MIRQCESILVKVCLYFTSRRPDDLRDLYQEIACTLWEAWPSYRGEGDLKNWVTRIALNVAGQEVRRRKRMPQFVKLDESFYTSLANEADDPRYQYLYSLIHRLNDEERKLLYLFLDHMRYREIAEITGSTENAVKQKLYRITQKLINLKNAEYGK